MDYCKKCGKEIKQTDKFCTNCGTTNISDNKTSYMEKQKDNIGTNLQVETNKIKITKNKTPKNSKLKVIIPIIIALLIIGIAGGIVFVKTTDIQKEKLKESIEVLNVDNTNYPNMVISIKANNYSKDLDIKNFTLKENDTFQKDLKLSMESEANKYKITYKTSDESTSGQRNIKIAYAEDTNESIAEGNYQASEKAKSKTSNSNNVVDTYDHNEIDVKQAIDDYEKAYIKMINSKDIYYIKSSIDLSGGLISEFTNLIKSYSDQDINEDLMDHKIEDIKKINDSQYEVTVYEKYYIVYGKERKYSYTDYRTKYIIDKTNSGFKVYSIKNIVTLGSKTNP